jgi:hypothetical protein
MSESYNKPYLWKRDPRIPEKCYGFYNWKERKTDSLIFMEGINLPASDIGKIHFSQDPATYDLVFDVQVEEARIRSYDCLSNNTAGPLVNKRVLELLQEMCPNDFQAFPAVIRSKQDKPITPYVIKDEYWLINVTKLVDCIDTDHSQLTFRDNGEIDDIRAIVFKEGCMQNDPVLLARERRYRPHIFVSPLIKDAFKKAKIKGARFVTDEEYNRDYFY